MNAWRLPLVLCLSVVFAAPVLGGMMQSSGDLLTAGLKYVAALCLAWFGVGAIAAMVDRFDHLNRVVEHERAVAAAMAADAQPQADQPDADPITA